MFAHIGSTFGHQVTSVALHCIAWFQSWPPGFVTCIAHWHSLSVCIFICQSHISLVCKRWLSQFETTGPIDRTWGHLGPIKIMDRVHALLNIIHNFASVLYWSDGVGVITSALHAEGCQFDKLLLSPLYIYSLI